MAKKETNDLLLAGGVVGLIIYGVYHFFFKNKSKDEPAPTVEDVVTETIPAGTNVYVPPGIAVGEPVPGTVPGTLPAANVAAGVQADSYVVVDGASYKAI